MSWHYERDQLEIFLTRISDHHPTIKFAASKDFDKIPLWDTIVYRGNNNHLLNRLYHKVADSKKYLYFNSSHP